VKKANALAWRWERRYKVFGRVGGLLFVFTFALASAPFEDLASAVSEEPFRRSGMIFDGYEGLEWFSGHSIKLFFIDRELLLLLVL
jgi:hypothetical protein